MNFKRIAAGLYEAGTDVITREADGWWLYIAGHRSSVHRTLKDAKQRANEIEAAKAATLAQDKLITATVAADDYADINAKLDAIEADIKTEATAVKAAEAGWFEGPTGTWTREDCTFLIRRNNSYRYPLYEPKHRVNGTPCGGFHDITEAITSAELASERRHGDNRKPAQPKPLVTTRSKHLLLSMEAVQLDCGVVVTAEHLGRVLTSVIADTLLEALEGACAEALQELQ